MQIHSFFKLIIYQFYFVSDRYLDFKTSLFFIISGIRATDSF